MEKTTMLVPLSINLKEHAATFAQSSGRSLSEVVRVALAMYVGYDLTSEVKNKETRGRPRIYENEADRKIALKQAADAKKKLVNMLIEDHRQQERRRDVKKIEESLERKGIPVN